MNPDPMTGFVEEYLNERIQPEKLPLTRVAIVYDFARWLAARGVQLPDRAPDDDSWVPAAVRDAWTAGYKAGQAALGAQGSP